MITHYPRIDNVTLEVHGTYYRGQSATRLDPAESEEFEIEKIIINGIEFSRYDFHLCGHRVKLNRKTWSSCC